jgi:amino acid transporter
MNIPWDGLAHVQHFFQLDFIFSGLEVSSMAVFLARVTTLIVFGGGLLYVLFQISLKLLDCLKAVAESLGPLPKSFFLLVLLVIPLSPDSLGAAWIGYIMLAASLLGVAAIGVMIVVVWKHGVDHLFRLLDNLRTKQEKTDTYVRDSMLPPDNLMGPLPGPAPLGRYHD